MLHRILFGLLFCLVALLSAPAHANPTMTLSSTTDLSNLTVGQKFEIDVSLSGLAVGSDFIFVLNTQESFSSSLLSAILDPTNSSGLTPGPGFFFDPSQIANFNATSSFGAGSAIGDFSDSAPNSSFAINENGLYYSFMLQAASVGSGTISFVSSGMSYAADDTGFNLAPIPFGGPLAFNISAASVPEPSSIALMTVSVAVLGCWTRARKKSAS
jgi:hypothetical protein